MILPFLRRPEGKIIGGKIMLDERASSHTHIGTSLPMWRCGNSGAVSFD